MGNQKGAPEITGKLRNFMLHVPEESHICSGIKIFGKMIRSVLFSTDVSIIRNTDADAVIAVYPFTPQPVITRSIMMAADIPVFCGVGGGLTGGDRVVDLAVEAEQQGALGVVVNAPTPNSTIEKVAKHLDVPIIVTVVSLQDDIKGRLDAGASIFNVSGAVDTSKIIENIRKTYPDVPIMATGGPNSKSIQETILAGANAVTWTPPSNGEVFKDIMANYRLGKPHP